MSQRPAPQKLTIVHVTAPAAVGGAESVVAALARGHAGMGHAVHVVSIFDAGAEGSPLGGGIPGVQTHVVATRPRRYWRERSAVAALVRTVGADVVHTHGYRTDVVDGSVARSLGLPVVTTVHGFTGGDLKNRFFEFLQERAFRRFDAVVAVSAPLVDRLVRAGVSSRKTHLVKNAWSPAGSLVDRRTARARLGLPLEGSIVGWVGRLSQEKGPDVFLESLPLMDRGAPLAAFIGDGRERAALEARAGALGMAANVRWCGQVPDASGMLPAFDAFVLSSRTEGTPIVLFEAMAAGVPIVAARVGGVPDVVSGEEALLVPPEDPSAIAAAVKRILDDPAASAARVAAARSRLERDFAVGPWLARYEAIYRGSVIRLIFHSAREMKSREDRKLRVLYVDYSVGFGGATKSLSLVLRALPGVEALVLTSQLDDIAETWYGSHRLFRFRRLFNYRNNERLSDWLQRRVPLGALRWVIRQLYARADDVAAVLAGLRIFWLLRRYRCDLIHLNNYFRPGEAIVAAKLARVPIVVHVRDLWYGVAGLDSRFARAADRAIAISATVANSLPADVIPPERVVTIHDPVDPEAFDAVRLERDDVRRSWGLPDDAVAFGILGRVIPWKGQLEFVRAVAAVMDRNPAVWAVIVGDHSDGARDYARAVEQVIRSSPSASRFVLTGYRADVERCYWALDVVVHASIETEPFGMVVPEGMFASRPVIAAREGGPTELITHGVNGLLVTPGDVEALADAVRTLASNGDERKRMGGAGYERVRKALDIPVVAAQVRAVYDELLSR